MGSCEIKRLSGHLLVRKRLLILSSRKNETLHTSTVLFSFLREVNTSRGSPCPQPFKFPNAPISIFLTNCAVGCGQQRTSFCFNLTHSEEQRFLACHHWQFQICRQSNAHRYLKVDSLWKQCMAWILPWPKCGFIYKGQRGIAIQETKEKQSHVGGNVSIWCLTSIYWSPCSWKFWAKFHQMEWGSW